MTQQTYSGGCQCGAVRFKVRSAPIRSTICHCRMCQKAFGSPFAALVEVNTDKVEWTRGAPSWFQSSDKVRRGFCKACGTPLAYSHDNGIKLATGAFDDPEKVPPTYQVNHSARLAFFDGLADLPVQEPDAEAPELRSFQHPHRDTEEWPPEFWLVADHF